MAVIQNIKNKLGTIVYPKTLTKAVYEEDGTRLDNEISTITSDISSLNDTITYKKVWTNQSPTSAFTAQTVSIDLSQYDYVDIICKFATTGSAHFSSRCFKGLVNAMLGPTDKVRYRVATVNANNIVFTQGNTMNTYGTLSADNSVIIPMYIYAGKFKP